MNLFQEEDDYAVSVEKKILRLIYENDVKSLREMKPHLRDLNFLEDFPEIEVDIGVTPLIVAAHLGRVEILKLLLENESLDVNLGSDDSQLTPLIIACAAGNYEIVEILINNGADVNLPDSSNRPPLYFCFIRLMEDTNIFENNLICMKMANMLLQSGADVNYVVSKEEEKTLLMEYSGVSNIKSEKEKETNFKVIKFLMEHGADPGLKSKEGKTSFDYAKQHTYPEELHSLLKNTHQTSFYKSPKISIPIPQVKVKKYKIFSLEGGAVRNACCGIFYCCNK